MSGHTGVETHTGLAAPAPSWRILRAAAEIYGDFQQFRIAAANRAERGGVPPEEFEGLLEELRDQEASLLRRLRRAYRLAVPVAIREWQASTLGLGEPTFARLLGHLGHPRHAIPWRWEGKGKDGRILVPDPPYERNIGQLWSYCGVGDPTRRRRAGMNAEAALACGSPRLRSLLFVISECCVKVGAGPYRAVYDEARVQYATRTHAAPCPPCGPPGRPAPEGSPWSKKHQHVAAMRKVAKEVLRDLWLAAGEEAPLFPEPTGRPPLPPASQSDHARAGVVG